MSKLLILLVVSVFLTACNTSGEKSKDIQEKNTEGEKETKVESKLSILKASNSDSLDYFGNAIAFSDDGKLLAVGAMQKDVWKGVVYIFKLDSNNNWEQQNILEASPRVNFGLFGSDVAFSDDGATLAVGATGSALVYIFNLVAPNTWQQQIALSGENSEVGDLFGSSVSLSNDGVTLAVGAPWEESSSTGVNSITNNDSDSAGAAYVFVKDSFGNWAQKAYMKSDKSEPGLAATYFGRDVSLDGSGGTLAVGMDGDDFSTGAVYLFKQNENHEWSQHSVIKGSNADENDDFGSSVSLSDQGNVLVVGAPGESNSTHNINTDDNQAFGSGAVYVFSLDEEENWIEEAYLKAGNIGSKDEFGHSVAINHDGTTIIVGAVLEDGSGVGLDSEVDDLSENSGAAYVFSIDNQGIWQQTKYLKANNTSADDEFGSSVSVTGDSNMVAVSAPYEDSGSSNTNNTPAQFQENSGAVYVYND